MSVPWKRPENEISTIIPFCKTACCYFRAMSVGNGYCLDCYMFFLYRVITEEYPVSSKDVIEKIERRNKYIPKGT